MQFYLEKIDIVVSFRVGFDIGFHGKIPGYTELALWLDMVQRINFII